MGQAIPIYVINLDRRTDRRNAIAKRMDELGLDWTRVPAIDADNPGDDTLGKTVALSNSESPERRIERARTASHYAVWKKLEGIQAELALVLEDDVTISDQLPDYLASVNWVPPQADIVKIEKYHPGNLRVLMGPPEGIGPDGRRLHRLYSRHAGAGGYIVRRGAVRDCLAHAVGLDLTIDQCLFDFGISRNARALSAYFVQPALVTQFHGGPHAQEHEAREGWRLRLLDSIGAVTAAPMALRHMLFHGARMRDVRWQNRAGGDD